MATREVEHLVRVPELDPQTLHMRGSDDASRLRIAVAVAQFNGDITSKLLDGALEVFRECGLPPANLVIAEVPGAWELPLIAARLVKTKRFDAVLALGAVIRGDTPHFDYVCNETARGLMNVSLDEDCVVTFGVITTDNDQQALDRVGGKHGNKGADTARAAIQTANLLKENL